MDLGPLEKALQGELPIASVGDLEDFPYGSHGELLVALKAGQASLATAYDPQAFDAVASGSDRPMHYLLAWSPFVVGVGLAVLAFVQGNYLLLVGIPVALAAMAASTPGCMRGLGTLALLVAIGGTLFNWYRGNGTLAYLFGAYAVPGFLTNVARQQCTMLLRKAAEKSEIVFVWLYLKRSIIVQARDAAG